MWSLLLRPIIGAYDHVPMKHLPAYLDELDWRYHSRRNPYLFRDTLTRLCHPDVLRYQELVAS